MNGISSQSFDSLDMIRKKIDSIDMKLMELLYQRACCSHGVASAKMTSSDKDNPNMFAFRPLRELRIHQTLDTVLAKQDGHYHRYALHHLWRTMIAASIRLQHTLRIFCQSDKHYLLQRYCDYIFGFQAECQYMNTNDVLARLNTQTDGIYCVCFDDRTLNEFQHSYKKGHSTQNRLFMEVFADLFISQNDASSVYADKEKKDHMVKKDRIFFITQSDEVDMQLLPDLKLCLHDHHSIEKESHSEIKQGRDYALFVDESCNKRYNSDICLGKYIQFPFK